MNIDDCYSHPMCQNNALVLLILHHQIDSIQYHLRFSLSLSLLLLTMYILWRGFLSWVKYYTHFLSLSGFLVLFCSWSAHKCESVRNRKQIFENGSKMRTIERRKGKQAIPCAYIKSICNVIFVEFLFNDILVAKRNNMLAHYRERARERASEKVKITKNTFHALYPFIINREKSLQTSARTTTNNGIVAGTSALTDRTAILMSVRWYRVLNLKSGTKTKRNRVFAWV